MNSLVKNILITIPILTMWYVTFYTSPFKCVYTGMFNSEVKTTNFEHKRMLTYSTDFNYCDRYNFTKNHFTLDILNSYNPPQSLTLYENFFGQVITRDEWFLMVLLLNVIPIYPIITIMIYALVNKNSNKSINKKID